MLYMKKISLLIFLALLPTSFFAQYSNDLEYYYINVELDVNKKLIEGTEIIYWKNSTKDLVKELRFHLFYNGYKNSNSTYAREGNITIKKENSGFIDITFIKAVDCNNSIIETKYIHPDDNNFSDETVLQVILEKPIYPNEAIKINLGFITKIPLGGLGQDGYARGKDFFLLSKWFPRLGVYEENKGWNCHQYHYWTGIYSNFSNYEINITIPENFSIGASSNPIKIQKNYDNTKTFYFKAIGYKDFAWFVSNDFYEIDEKFSTEKIPAVNIKLFLQNRNKKRVDKILYAIKNGIKYYSEWISAFPFNTITIVDLPRTCFTNFSSYPGLFTFYSDYFIPDDDFTLEERIIQSLGRQYFSYSMNINLAEEPWIDGGIVTFLTGKILQKCYPIQKSFFRIAGGIPIDGLPIITYNDFPIVAYMGSVYKPYFPTIKSIYLNSPERDPIYKNGWRYYNQETYYIGATYKPALMFETMCNYFGTNLVIYSIRSFYQNYHHSFTNTGNLIKSIEKNFGKKLSWFFNQVLFETEVIDNSVVSINNSEFQEGKFLVEVVFSRNGVVKIPVDIKIFLENGLEINDSWDCNEKWIKKSYIVNSPAKSAIIDPYNKVALDVNTNNNSKTVEGNYKPVLKWAAQWLFWMQTLLQTLCSIC